MELQLGQLLKRVSALSLLGQVTVGGLISPKRGGRCDLPGFSRRNIVGNRAAKLLTPAAI
jgi:hypothetical protein